MTRRVFYLALGATVGVLVVRRLSAAAQQLRPESAARRFAGALNGFVDDVRANMAVREGELRSALGVGGESPESA
jgi:hypothetical protein